MSSRGTARHISGHHPQRRERGLPSGLEKTRGHQCRVTEKAEDTPGRTGQEGVPRGTCRSMCPTKELRDREVQNRLHRFEVLAGTERDRRPRADPARAVKEYSRPAAGRDATNPSDLRPPAVLLRTVCYLIDDIIAPPNQHWTEVYDFVFDRLRSMRQDLIIQRASGPDCVAVLERTVRFLVYASYRLCGEPLHLYDPRINDTHLQECLSWLLNCYAEEPGPHPNQAEFQALSLLYNLGSARVLLHTLNLSQRLRLSPGISLCLSINRAFLERNPVRLLRLARGLNFLQGCALHRHLVACRGDLLRIYSHGFSSRNCCYPLPRLSGLLALDRPPAAQLCRAHGLEVRPDDQVVFSRTSFTEVEPGKWPCAEPHRGLSPERRSGVTLAGVMHGRTPVDRRDARRSPTHGGSHTS